MIDEDGNHEPIETEIANTGPELTEMTNQQSEVTLTVSQSVVSPTDQRLTLSQSVNEPLDKKVSQI